MDRRRLLTGLALAGTGPALLGLGACDRKDTTPVDESQLPSRDLAFDLSDLERANGGRIGLSALDSRRVSWRADERFNYCSTFKMFLAGATLERVVQGAEKIDRAIPVTAADMIPHAPVTETAVGQTLTIEQLMKAAVEVSDNPAANILIREMGGLDALRAWYRRAGDETTSVDRLEPFLNRKDGDKDTALPFQTATNIDWMLTTYMPLVFQSRYRPLWDWLIDSTTGRDRIKAGVPEGWTIAHKTGTGGKGQTNDIGVVYPSFGDPIPLAVYYDAPETLAEDKRDAVIAEATRRAMTLLGHMTPEPV